LSRAIGVIDDAALEHARLERIEDIALVAVGLRSAIGDVRKTITIGSELVSRSYSDHADLRAEDIPVRPPCSLLFSGRVAASWPRLHTKISRKFS
jgi:hypothetical protein